MMNCLVLAIHDLVAHPPSKELQKDLSAIIHQHYIRMFQAGSRLSEMAREYEATGGKPLSQDEILEEVDERQKVLALPQERDDLLGAGDREGHDAASADVARRSVVAVASEP